MRLLALHGFTGRGASWDAVIRHLPEDLRELRVDAPDLPGHRGHARDAEPPKSFDAESFDATLELLAGRHLPEARADDPVHLAGYSLGGRLALGLALRHPERIASLTLISARPGLDESARADRLEQDRRLASEARRDLEAFIDRWQRLPLFESQNRLPRRILDAQRRQRLSHDPEGLAWALDTLSPARMPDYRPRLGTLTRPACFLVGALDVAYVELARAMAERLPAARLEIVPGAGHNLLLEAPEAVAGAFVATLRGRGQAPPRRRNIEAAVWR